MKRHIFFSWQSDTDQRHNRYLIRDALDAAAKRLSCEVDEATREVPGSPPIFETILRKIDQSVAFVGDVTIVTGDAPRSSCNPNVLIEYGYALAKLGDSRLISVLNRSYGAPEKLPFDLRHKAVRAVYALDSSDKTVIKSANELLEQRFTAELRLVLEANLAGPSVEAFLAKWQELSDSTRNVVAALLREGGEANEVSVRNALMTALDMDVNSASRTLREAKIQLVKANLVTVSQDIYSSGGDRISVNPSWRSHLKRATTENT